jgi:alpha-glucosidase
MIQIIKEKLARVAVDLHWWRQNRIKLHLLEKNAGQLRRAGFQQCGNFTLETQQGPTLGFVNPDGVRLLISIPEDWLLHIRLLPDGRPRLDRTWSVCSPGEDVPFSGRPRDNYQGFSCPAYTIDENEHTLSITTARLRLELNRASGSLRVTDPRGRLLVEDSPLAAMARDTKTSRIRHRTMLRDGELLLGFGEKSGRLSRTAAAC